MWQEPKIFSFFVTNRKSGYFSRCSARTSKESGFDSLKVRGSSIFSSASIPFLGPSRLLSNKYTPPLLQWEQRPGLAVHHPHYITSTPPVILFRFSVIRWQSWKQENIPLGSGQQRCIFQTFIRALSVLKLNSALSQQTLKFNKTVFTSLLSVKEQEQPHHSAKRTCIQRIYECSFNLTMKSNSDCFKILKFNQTFLSSVSIIHVKRRKTASVPITKWIERRILLAFIRTFLALK